MTSKPKDLRRLKRSELIDIIAHYQRREKELLEENRILEEKLNDRSLRLSNAGSIAEAALAFNGVFEAAQAAADQYLEEIRRLQAELRERSAAESGDALAEDPAQEKEAGTNGKNRSGSI